MHTTDSAHLLRLSSIRGDSKMSDFISDSGIGPRSELNRLSSNDLVLNNEALWIDNNEVGRSMSDHSFSQMAFRVPNVPDFSFRSVTIASFMRPSDKQYSIIGDGEGTG